MRTAMPAPEAPPNTAPTTRAAMMGTARRRWGTEPTVGPDADAGPDANPEADDDLDGGIDAATDGAEDGAEDGAMDVAEEDEVEERGLRVG